MCRSSEITKLQPIYVSDLKHIQQRSLKAEKVPHIKGRLLNQAMILFNCVPFHIGTSLKRKNLLPEKANSLGANSFLYEQFLVV